MAFGSEPSVEAVRASLAATDGGARAHLTLKKHEEPLLRVRLDAAQHTQVAVCRAEYPTEYKPAGIAIEKNSSPAATVGTSGLPAAEQEAHAHPSSR